MSRSIDVWALNTTNLAAFRQRGIRVPDYPRDVPSPRIVHIGVGGFHRSHMALYTDELARRGCPWRICGLGLLPGDQRMSEVLDAQDHLYTLIERQSEHVDVTVIGSITDFCWFSADLSAAAQRIAESEVEIVSLTITEGGYALDREEPPALATIVSGLELRRASGRGALTVLSCDNLPGNGDVARNAVLSVASNRSPELARWIDETCAFPNSMVDRITPVTADSDRQWLRDTHGIDDQWPVVGETFRQWVIEDRFAVSRPRWEDAGALFTDDVHAWELYKLRMLNAAHSSMAYLCSLAGIEFVDEGIADPAVRQFLERFLAHEAIPTLAEIPGHPREDYAATVLERFGNTGVRDQISRLCIDGAAKYPIFLIPTVAAQLAMDGPIDLAALALAGWARYLAVVPEGDQAYDASADRARPFAQRALQDPLAFLDFEDVFPADLRDHPRFRASFGAAWRSLADGDPRAAMMC